MTPLWGLNISGAKALFNVQIFYAGLEGLLHPRKAPRFESALLEPSSKAGGERLRTVEILGGSGSQGRGEPDRIWFRGLLRSLGRFWNAAGGFGQECPTHTGRDRGHFQRRLKICRKAGGFFGRVHNPLVEGGADAAALGLVIDNHEAKPALARDEAVSHGVDAGEHAVESEGHVIVFGELDDGEHAADGGLGG